MQKHIKQLAVHSPAEDQAILVTPWIPTADSDFTTSMHTKSGVQRIRRLLPHHLTDFPWLAVITVGSKKGALCMQCVLFAATSGVGGRALGHGQLRQTSPNVISPNFVAILYRSIIDSADCCSAHSGPIPSAIMVDYVGITLRSLVYCFMCY